MMRHEARVDANGEAQDFAPWRVFRLLSRMWTSLDSLDYGISAMNVDSCIVMLLKRQLVK